MYFVGKIVARMNLGKKFSVALQNIMRWKYLWRRIIFYRIYILKEYFFYAQRLLLSTYLLHKKWFIEIKMLLQNMF